MYAPILLNNISFDFTRPYTMGVLNVTPDSFSDGGRYLDPQRALAWAEQLVAEGADIIDIGGESSRPGAAALSAEEERARVIPVLRALAPKLSVPISIDTYKAVVAEAAVGEGAALVNDISTLGFDAELAPTVARLGVPLVLMHTRGRPAEMQQGVCYEDVVEEVAVKLASAIETAERSGVEREKIIVDPGFGFGKRLEDNHALMKGLPRLQARLGRPVLVGLSRKSSLGQVTGVAVPEERLGASVAAAAIAALWGANILRVHDVRESVQAIRIGAWLRT